MYSNLATLKGGKSVLLFSNELSKPEKDLLLNNIKKAVNETVSVWVYKSVNNKFILLNDNKPTFSSYTFFIKKKFNEHPRRGSSKLEATK